MDGFALTLVVKDGSNHHVTANDDRQYFLCEMVWRPIMQNKHYLPL